MFVLEIVSTPQRRSSLLKKRVITRTSRCVVVVLQSSWATCVCCCSAAVLCVCCCVRLEPTCKLARAALCKLHVDRRGCVSDSRDQIHCPKRERFCYSNDFIAPAWRRSCNCRHDVIKRPKTLELIIILLSSCTESLETTLPVLLHFDETMQLG